MTQMAWITAAIVSLTCSLKAKGQAQAQAKIFHPWSPFCIRIVLTSGEEWISKYYQWACRGRYRVES